MENGGTDIDICSTMVGMVVNKQKIMLHQHSIVVDPYVVEVVIEKGISPIRGLLERGAGEQELSS
jgi:hypothetical protein